MPVVRPPLPPGPFLVVGLAGSGAAVAPALAARGERVVGVDAGAVASEARAALEAAGVATREHDDGVALLEGVATVVKSPGVPQDAAVVAAARARGVPVVGELEIGWRLIPNELIAITGSNGKTTTTELLGFVHRLAGVPVAVAGNVGPPLSSFASLEPAAVVVCEASSFQLEDTAAFAPDAAVLLNVTEDHLDRHATFERYREAKLQVFARQPPGALAVAPSELDVSGAGGEATWVCFSETGDADLALRDGALIWRGDPLMRASEIRLRGPHNRQNAMAAATVALARRLAPGAVCEALATFAGVPHRLEEVATIDGVLYVNDSKATNVASALVGIGSFERDVRAILGGRGKGADFTPLAPVVAERCAAVYLIGEAAEPIAEALTGAGVPLHHCGDLERAVAAARGEARPGDAVLLSPACASYDQYRSFEHRGEHFREIVAALRR